MTTANQSSCATFSDTNENSVPFRRPTRLQFESNPRGKRSAQMSSLLVNDNNNAGTGFNGNLADSGAPETEDTEAATSYVRGRRLGCGLEDEFSLRLTFPPPPDFS